LKGFCRLEIGLAQAKSLAAIAGRDHAVAGAFQQQADGALNRHIVIHDQYSCQRKVLRRRWITNDRL